MDDQYRSNFVGHDSPPSDDDDNKQDAPPQVMDFKPPSKHPTAPLVGPENDTISPEPAPPLPDEPDESPVTEEKKAAPTDDDPDSSSNDKPPEGDKVEVSSGAETHEPEESEDTADTDTPAPSSHNFSVETAMKEAAVPAVLSSSGPAKRPRSKLATALIIVLIAAAMIAGALYFYLQNGKTDKPKATSSTSTQQTTTAEPAKSTDVDGALKAIDTDTQTASDNKDVSSADLADAALGL